MLLEIAHQMEALQTPKYSAFLGVLLLLGIYTWRNKQRNLPPGPWGVPYFGALCSFSFSLADKMLTWRRTYGDVISYYKHGQLHIILTSEWAIKEAFVKRGNEFSFVDLEVFELLCIQDEIFAGPYNNKWKQNKKFAVVHLKAHGFGTTDSHHIIQHSFTAIEDDILNRKNRAIDLFPYLKQMAAAMMCKILFNRTGSYNDQEAVHMSKLTVQWYASFNTALLAYLSNENRWFPSRKPQLSTIPDFVEFRKRNKELLEFVREMIRTELESKENQDSVSYDYLERERKLDDQDIERVVRNVAMLIPDSVFTAALSIYWSVLFLITHPKVLKKAQEEIQTSIGKTKWPTWGDMSNLPYVESIITETFRLTYITPISTRRVLPYAIEFKGYTLPKGSIVHGSFQCVHFNPDIFEEPSEFRPERFIKDDGSFDAMLAGRLLTFSIGSRKCPGNQYVKMFSFLVITRLLQRFHLHQDPDAHTPSLEEDKNFFFAKPYPYTISLTPKHICT